MAPGQETPGVMGKMGAESQKSPTERDLRGAHILPVG